MDITNLFPYFFDDLRSADYRLRGSIETVTKYLDRRSAESDLFVRRGSVSFV